MDLSELPDVRSHDVSVLYTTIAQQQPSLSDFGSSQCPMSLHLQQQHELASGCHASLETVPDSSWSASGLFQLAQSTNSSITPMGLPASTFYLQSEQYTFDAMLSQKKRGLQNPFKRKPSDPQPTPPKRRRKAVTMSDQLWEPSIGWIRQLYVEDGKPIKEVRKIINAEFGFEATERQYKAKISKMNLERKCNIEQRRVILQHVQYRRQKLGKESRHVRVRGHMLSAEKIARWLKEPALMKSLSNVRPPSPLPSEIGVRTALCLNSAGSGAETLSYNHFLAETQSSLTLRLLGNAQQGNQVIDAHQARSVFNDIQQLLETRNDPTGAMKGYKWRLSLEQNLVNIQNMMNLSSQLLVDCDSNSSTPTNNKHPARTNTHRLAKHDFKAAAWQTQYGRIEVSFWSAGTDSDGENLIGKTTHSASMAFARIALYTRSVTESTVCVNFDFNPLGNLPIKLTYQAMVPDNSEVFHIIGAGDVEVLKKALVMKTASLTDRDSNGRSLLSYAVTGAKVDMCRFLLTHGADMNAMELNSWEFMGPVYTHYSRHDCENIEENLRAKSECYQVMLESGADLSLEIFVGRNMWQSSYEFAVLYDCYTTFRQMLILGQPFIGMDTKVAAKLNLRGKITPLIWLAGKCRDDPAFGLDRLEKVILLLSLHADITYVDEGGNNVLHYIHQSLFHGGLEKDKEMQAKAWMVDTCDCDRCNTSFRESRQLLKATIAAGANIYAINEFGDTPTMVAEAYGRDEEWIETLEECKIDVEEVLLHTTAWKTVLDELENQYSAYSSELKAKIVEDFESNFRGSGNIRQRSSLSFEEFCEQRQMRRKLQVDCDYYVANANYRSMIRHLRNCEAESTEWVEDENEKPTETLENVVEDALSHAEDELDLQESIYPFGPTELLNGEIESDNHDRAIDILDDLANPIWNDDVVDTGSVYSSNRDLDMADVYWHDPLDLEVPYVGTPSMSFYEFTTLMDGVE